MVSGDFGDTFGFLHEFHPFRAPVVETEQEAVFINFEGFALKANFSHAAPVVETEQEAVFINFEGFALKANFSHACPPWTFALFGPCGPSQTAEAYGVRLIPH